MPVLSEEDQANSGRASLPAKDVKDATTNRAASSPTPAPRPRGISDVAAKEAHDFMQSVSSRMSGEAHSPGLTDDLADKAHSFMVTSKRRHSHSKHLPDITDPGLTDEVIQDVGVFEEQAEGGL